MTNDITITDDITDIEDLVNFANAWRDLGDAVQEQVEDVLLERDDELNPSAIRTALEHHRLGRFPRISQVLREWLENNDGDGDED